MGLTDRDRRLREAAELIAGLEAIIRACEPAGVLAALHGVQTDPREAEQARALRARARAWLAA